VDNTDGDKKSLPLYNYDKGRTATHINCMPRPEKWRLIKPIADELVNAFLAEVLTIVQAHERCSLVADALAQYFASLDPYRRSGDFQMNGTLPPPASLKTFVEPHVFYGHFRAWLRKQGINPDSVEVPDAA
jgi:hypothetical protein